MTRINLEDLRRQLDTLQQVAGADADRLRELLPPTLAGVQRALADLLQSSEALELEPALAAAAQATAARAQPAQTAAGASPQPPKQESSPQADVLVRLMDNALQCRWASPSWLSFTGCAMAEVLGTAWIACVHPEDVPICTQFGGAVADADRVAHAEYRVRRPGGQYTRVLESAPRTSMRAQPRAAGWRPPSRSAITSGLRPSSSCNAISRACSRAPIRSSRPRSRCSRRCASAWAGTWESCSCLGSTSTRRCARSAGRVSRATRAGSRWEPATRV